MDDFKDTMSMPRRQHYEPTDFAPAWYRHGVASCSGACDQGRKKCPTFDACRIPVESDFGALEGLVTARWIIAAPWVVIAIGAAVMIFFV